MITGTRTTLDAVLEGAVRSRPGVPGVAAVVTDRSGVIYSGAAGVRSLASGRPFTTDTLCHLQSATKPLTATVCLQLVDDGLLDLDAPAREYVPAIGEIQVLDRFDDDGEPVVRPPLRDITTRMLLLHTAGFGYSFFNERYLRLARAGLANPIEATVASISSPLLFDPGDRWEYGCGLDWAGLVVEGITGRRLGAVMDERVLRPLGMTSTTFRPGPEQLAGLASVHARLPDGSLTEIPFEVPADPELDMGGHGLYSTADDYVRFIRMWLDDGRGPDGPILRAGTVAAAATDGLGELSVTPLPGVVRRLTNDVDFFPGHRKGWGLSFLVNDDPAATGRPAGSLGWAGLTNIYFWIDRTNGIGGFWATQLLPFADRTALGASLAFETAVYDGLT